jgi:argininosuccinate lyase
MAKKLWGGRFKKEIDKDFFKFQKSIHYDYKLAEYDIYHSRFHVELLEKANILTNKEATALDNALYGILKQILEGKFKPDLSCEDIHTDIQNRVEKKIGKKAIKLALKLHTLRSRNAQIAFDTKSYCKKKNELICSLLKGLKSSFDHLARINKDIYIPSYTHTQRAQAIPFRDYLGAFTLMFKRDYERIEKFLQDYFIDIGPGTLANSSISDTYQKAIENLVNKHKKMFRDYSYKVMENSLDAISNRDFIIELLSILSILQMHLSRLAEDFILYSTKEFNFFNLPEEFCTGSSLMPHKKNPDFLELVRGYTGRIYGNLISVLTTMKGLPLTYNRDMQLDKEPLFSSVEIIEDELKIMAKFIKKVTIKREVVEKVLEEDRTLYATELADWLVRKHAVSFKQAHDIVGKIIILTEKKGGIEKVKDVELKKFYPELSQSVIKQIMNLKYAKSIKSLNLLGLGMPSGIPLPK